MMNNKKKKKKKKNKNKIMMNLNIERLSANLLYKLTITFLRLFFLFRQLLSHYFLGWAKD